MLMVKAELGTKRVCVACSTRFYDLMKAPAICPKCGTEQPADVPRPRRASTNVPVEDKRPKKPVPVAEDADLEAELPEAEEADEDVLEDASDLEDDADEIGGDIDVPTDAEPEES
jgi:uncharacterized protein (TIGR02300 family)